MPLAQQPSSGDSASHPGCPLPCRCFVGTVADPATKTCKLCPFGW